ncbi:hypothetical protein H8E07_11080, partial [bacterium]|nr:hypothetical protein [bacterium]
MTKKLIPIIILAAILGGCSGDDPVDPGPVVIPYDWPETAEQLMANFERAYSEMNIDEYGIVLHEDFKFIFIDSMETW